MSLSLDSAPARASSALLACLERQDAGTANRRYTPQPTATRVREPSARELDNLAAVVATRQAPTGRRARANAIMVGQQPAHPWSRHDRRARVAILRKAEDLELRTKPRGKTEGCLGHVGLEVLKCLLFQFLSYDTGQCDPSYIAIMKKTKRSRGAVTRALRRLEAVGFLLITRRMARVPEKSICPVTGRTRITTVLRQITNAYVIQIPTCSVPIPPTMLGCLARPAYLLPHCQRTRRASEIDRTLLGQVLLRADARSSNRRAESIAKTENRIQGATNPMSKPIPFD